MLVTAKEYWERVEECRRMVEEEGYDIHTVVGHHEYIIYTQKAIHVLLHTKSLHDIPQQAIESQSDNPAKLVSTMAHYAMLSDIR